MADVIRFQGDPHKLTQKLLPWYANGTLDADETAAVEAHLEGCDECRAELESERALGAMIATVPSDVERGWSALRGRIESERPQHRSAPWRRAGALWRRPIPMGWAITAQAACLVLVAGAAVLAMPAGVASMAKLPSQPLYRALGAPKTVTAGNLVVIFKPSTSEQELRGALRFSGARLVDGPTASDAYVLHVSDAERPVALKRLRADGHVVLAEPIDGEAQP